MDPKLVEVGPLADDGQGRLDFARAHVDSSDRCAFPPPFPMCTGSPRLEVLRAAPPSPCPPAGCRRRGKTRDGSRVHCGSLVGVGARLCPCGLAASTPQTFLAASPGSSCPPPREFPARHEGRVRAAPGPDPPGSSRCIRGPPHISSSRTPLRPACRTRPIWQCLPVPALSGLLPPSPASPGVR